MAGTPATEPSSAVRQIRGAGLALGFALGGFFDGILLHQVLQWHHLLSGVAQARQDLRLLILTDGLFHLLMYVIAAAGLYLLWRGRRRLAAPGTDRRLAATALFGFGGWHAVDAVLSHWVLGIHRIRMDTDSPLLWDLLWLAALGLVPIALGWAMHNGRAPGQSLNASPLALVLATAISAPLAALPPPDRSQLVVLFRPDVSDRQIMHGVLESGAALLGSDSSGQLWAISITEDSNPTLLYRHGALLVSNALLPFGCLNWTVP